MTRHWSGATNTIRPRALGPADSAHLAAAATAAIKRSPPSASRPRPTPAGICRLSSTSPVWGSTWRSSHSSFSGCRATARRRSGDAGDESGWTRACAGSCPCRDRSVDLAGAMLPDPQRAFGRARQIAASPGAGMMASTRRSGDRSSGCASRRSETGVVRRTPCRRARTSSVRTVLPLAGSRAFSRSPEANQHAGRRRSHRRLVHAREGPYSLRISAGDVFMPF